MKKVVLTVQVFITFLLYSTETKPITIITQEWPPYNYFENGEIKGFSYEIVKYILNDLNIKSEIRLLSDFRAGREFLNNSEVIYFTLFRTPKRETKYKWIGPINHEALYFYKKKGSSLQIKTLEDAKRITRISVRNQGLVYEYLKNKGFHNLDPTESNKSIYIKVLMERDELAIGETPFGVKYLLKKLNQPLDSLEKTGVKILEHGIYIAASKDIPDSEIKLWQNSLDKMKASGEYDELYQKYIN